MNPRALVEAFYSRIWNASELAAAEDLLAPDFEFRGSLGAELRGREAFLEYVRSVRGALAEYRCDTLECVVEAGQAFAKMRFSGMHVRPLRGYEPTHLPLHWHGAALFRCEGDRIASVWVLGDLAGLDALLVANAWAVKAARAEGPNDAR